MSAALSKSNTLSELFNSEIFYDIIGAPVKDFIPFSDLKSLLNTFS